MLRYQDEPIHEALELCGGIVIGHVAQAEQCDGQVGEVDLVPAGLHLQSQRTHQLRYLAVENNAIRWLNAWKYVYVRIYVCMYACIYGVFLFWREY